MTLACPTCGHALAPTEDVSSLANMRVTLMQKRILIALIAAHPAPASSADLVKAMWPDHPPSEPVQTLKVQMTRLRSALAQINWTIPRARGGHGLRGEYRLERLTP